MNMLSSYLDNSPQGAIGQGWAGKARSINVARGADQSSGGLDSTLANDPAVLPDLTHRLCEQLRLTRMNSLRIDAVPRLRGRSLHSMALPKR
jgi:hypothetical protein